MDWLSLPDFTEFSSLLLAQTPSPSPSPSPSLSPADVELLKSQLEFLNKSHNQFSESMKQFVDTMKIIFTVLGIALGIGGSVAGIGGAVAVYFFGKSFKDFQEFVQKDIRAFQEFSRREVQEAVERVRQEAETRIPQLVEAEVIDLVRAEVASVERTLRREQVIGSTLVDYYLPNGTSDQKEVELLRVRKFKQVQFFNDIQALSDTQLSRRSSINVVVLDLVNYTTPLGKAFQSAPEQEREDVARPLIDALLEFLPDSTVLIVYVNVPPPLRYINSIPKNRYVFPANNLVTLVGNVADGAYVVAGDRRARNA